jgi:predicted nucleic acid-binding protein
MGLIYLDACLVIYAVQRDDILGQAVKDALSSRGHDTFAISPLVRLECLVGPLKQADPELESDFRRASNWYVNLSVPDAAFDEAAVLRARHGLKTPDALHLAIARGAGCTALWTNDDRFAKAAPGYAVDIKTLSY